MDGGLNVSKSILENGCSQKGGEVRPGVNPDGSISSNRSGLNPDGSISSNRSGLNPDGSISSNRTELNSDGSISNNRPGAYRIEAISIAATQSGSSSGTSCGNLPVAVPIGSTVRGVEHVINDPILILDGGKPEKKLLLLGVLTIPSGILLTVVIALLKRKTFADHVQEILFSISGKDIFEDKSSTQYYTWKIISRQLLLRKNHVELLNNPLDIIERYLAVLIPVSTMKTFLWEPDGQTFEVCEVYPCSDDGLITHMILRNSKTTLYGGGKLVTEIGELKGLTHLVLSRYALDSTLPTEIGKLERLRVLDLRGNKFYGTIPSEIGKLRNLELLFLDNNQFKGSIPSEIGNLNNLLYADFSNNQLNGTIPSKLGNAASLEGMSLAQNNITGTVDFLCEKSFSNEWYLHHFSTYNYVVVHNIDYEVELSLTVDCIEDKPMVECTCCICT